MVVIIKPNEIKVENNSLQNEKKTTAREAIKKFIKVEDECIQYVKQEIDGDLLSCNMHPFVQAAHICYSAHLPLIISPDMIWYLISSATATHINLKSEELRNKFVNHEGKKRIEVRRDDFLLKSTSNPWSEVIDEFCTKIEENTNNDIAKKLLADFSTTSKDARVVSQIVLMDAMQKYFEYYFSTMCGIPEIRVTGNKSDWVSLKEKFNAIVELIPDFKIWKNSLDEILDHFVNIFDNKIDNKFWNEIYKVGGGSGGPYLSGWLIAFFPYLNEGAENRYISKDQTWRNASEGHFSGLKTSSFKYHMNQVPFTWNFLGNEIEMLFVGGLLGVLCEKDNALRPVFGYAVTENKPKLNDKN